MGIPFFRAIFQRQLFDSYKKAVNHAQNNHDHLTIQLNIKAPQLINVPWEYQYDNEFIKDFLIFNPKVNISLTRFLASGFLPNLKIVETPTNLPLRVLVIISNPRAEYANVDERLEKAWLNKLHFAEPKRLEVDYLVNSAETPASFSRLAKKLDEKQFDILHFLGHGNIIEGKQGFLVFEDERELKNRGIEPVTGKRLARALAEQKQLKLVFLNSCLTGHNQGKTFFNSVAASLLEHSNIAYVVAMQFKVADDVGSTFAECFYHKLSAGKTIEEAMLAARCHVYDHSYQSKENKEIYRRQWGIPACYTQYNKPLRLVSVSTDVLIQQARLFASNEKYQEAIETWKEIRAIEPSYAGIDSQIQQLKNQQQRANEITNFTTQLSMTDMDITLLETVTRRLKQSRKEAEYTQIAEFIKEFLNEEITLKGFHKKWEKITTGDFTFSNLADESHYQLQQLKILIERLKRGEIVLFLGSDISRLPNENIPFTETVAKKLADCTADYDGIFDSLSMIAEYYQMSVRTRQSLIAQLQQWLKTIEPSTPLYQWLAKIDKPLVMISAAYDTLLEDAFEQLDKKYILVFPLVCTIPGIDCGVGHILVKYSDKETFESPCPIDNLSALIETDYSVIYKARGYFKANGNQVDALMLSEENYFTFARYMNKLIPDYLVEQYDKNGLLFLGYTPKQWEDRLIAHAILEQPTPKISLIQLEQTLIHLKLPIGNTAMWKCIQLN
jgi:hypothetical protein